MNFAMLIDGELVPGSTTMPVIDPSSAQEFAQAPDCSDAELDAAVAAAQRAYPRWRDIPIGERRAALERLIAILESSVDLLVPILTQEQGKPIAAAGREFDSVLRFMKGLCALDLPEVVNEDTLVRRSVTRRVPLGVVAALSPWNYPVLLSWWKVIPALLAGNTMVLKPSPLTPLTVLKMGELVANVLPPGVLNVISGGDSLGPRLVAHEGVRKVSFTGSTQTGRKVAESASSTLKRLTLELGGNDAAIVLPDADIASAVPQIFWAAFTNSGQVCLATKRLYVHVSIYDSFSKAFAAYAATVKVGPGLEKESLLGPIQNAKQHQRVLNLIDEAKEDGLRLLFQGEAPSGPGYFVPVTLFDNPPESSRVVSEEAFGPVLPLLRFESIEEVIERANASPYGLGGSVWSRNEDQAVEVASRLETGHVFINEPFYLSHLAPLAGHKQSGIGVENGVEGLLSFTEPQTLMIRRG